MKRYKTTAPPPGFALLPRNTRLYGGLDEQVAGAALRARGCPSPDNAYVPARPRAELRVERETAAHRARLQRAQDAMLSAQREVRRLKSHGQPFADAATLARAARAEYLNLNGGTERRTVELAQASDANKVKAS